MQLVEKLMIKISGLIRMIQIIRNIISSGINEYN